MRRRRQIGIETRLVAAAQLGFAIHRDLCWGRTHVVVVVVVGLVEQVVLGRGWLGWGGCAGVCGARGGCDFRVCGVGGAGWRCWEGVEGGGGGGGVRRRSKRSWWCEQDE